MKAHSAKVMVPAVALVLAGLTFIACRNSARRSGVGGGGTVEVGFAQESSPATATAENEYDILSRGEDHSVIGKVTEYRTTNGTPFYITNRYTLLENGLNYQENGQWRTSEDLIENFAEGAVARRGAHKGIFAHDLNTDAVFDLQSSTGVRLRGGVRSIHLTDVVNGRSVLIGSVKASAPGELLPPNRIVYRDAFEGVVRADVLLVWKHNAFAQDVILRSRPVLPDGFAPESTRLEIVTEFIEPPQPEITQTRPDARRPDFVDDRFIRFGNFNIIGGQAFSVENGAGVSLGADIPFGSAAPVAKQWDILEDGRKVLIESLAWDELLPHLNQLPVAAVEGEVNGRTAIALQRMVPKTRSDLRASKPLPLEIASADYNPKGYVIDFLVVPDETSNNIFVTGETYVVWGSYYASSATFQPGCVIKNHSTGRIVLTGSFSFPDTLQSCVFTSIDDDTFGERIFGKTHLIRNSDGDPSTDRPNSLLQVSNLHATTEVRNCLFRWGVYGLAYFQTAASSTHTVRNCRFENFQSASGSIAALHISIPTSSTVSLVTSDMCNVDLQKYDPSSRVTGSLAAASFFTDKRFAGQNWLGWRSLTPDCMGAAGPNHFVQIINDWIRVYTKNGAIVAGNDMTMSYFFLRYNPTDASDVRMIDPRITYDFQSQAWAALALDRQKNNPTLDIVLAIKNSTDPTSLTSWTRHTITTANSTWTTDWPTLATDKNGLYITAPRLGTRDANGYDVVNDHVVIGAKKPGVFTSQTLTYNTLSIPSTDIYAIQPAHNYDDPPIQNYVWFIAKKFPTGTGPNYQPGQIVYRRAFWHTNGQLTFFDSSWLTLPNCSPAPAKYFDLDRLPTSAGAPQKGRPYKIELHIMGSRLMNAVIRNNTLWTCHHVGLDGADQDYDGDELGDTVDRSAIRWLKIQINSDGTLSCSAVGMIADIAVSDPYWYYMPSIMVNSSGNALLGFSGSKTSEYIGAFYHGRLANGSFPGRIQILQPGEGEYQELQASRWGDYTVVALDPVDSSSFWTVQEYVAREASWATWIGSIISQ